ncbi:hypothetical protein N018_03960 [Pseudomonas syringae CC1557]|uniref:Uncharacterized protein n=1 Tax=Pseudomonas syringae CC1557 TaxID=1357279 RepID=W0N373_PSESX|nr:hypothetical protein N018_03960 [Pseudomonas syringae CC1557]
MICHFFRSPCQRKTCPFPWKMFQILSPFPAEIASRADRQKM